MIPTPLQTPAGYVALHGVGFADENDAVAPVTSTNPLPVSISDSSPSVQPAPLAGSAGASALIGPFDPAAGIPVVLTLSGQWSGTAKVQRSTDGGVTRHDLTVGGNPWAQFTGNANEPVWEEYGDDGLLYLDIVLASGTLTYRLGH